MSVTAEMLSRFRRKKPDNSPPPASQVLTESLIYIRKYREHVSVEDTVSILGTSGYEILSGYFGLKLFDSNHEVQQQVLKSIVDIYANNGNHAEAARAVRDKVKASDKIDNVQPKILSRVALLSPNLVDERSQEILSAVEDEHRLPVIVAYGGLLALKATVEKTKDGEKFFVVFPKKTDTEEMGYSVTRNGTEINVVPLTEDDLSTESPVAVIDDVLHSGATFDRVRGVLPHADIKNFALFRK
jgi:hypothetical protein